MLNQLVIASSNHGKVGEFKTYLNDLPVEIITLEGKNIEAPIEDGESFSENALIKANYYNQILNLPVLSDDSGLCIEALGGKPSINTAYYAEKPDRYAKIFKNMQNSQIRTRDAEFICVLCFLKNNDIPLFFEGRCKGTISDEPRGNLGFGFDAIFIPNGSIKTFGEMTKEEKLSYSSRGQALNHFKDYISRNEF